jgi:transposase
VFGEESGLPFYYRKLAGNIPDVKTYSNLLEDVAFLGLKKVKFVNDRGFYSEDNINDLYRKDFKFIASTKNTLNYIKSTIDSIYNSIGDFQNYNPDFNLHALSVPYTWSYQQKKGEIKNINKQMYIHIYFNKNRATDEESKLDKSLSNLHIELLSGNRKEKNESNYEKYFNIESVQGKIKVTPKEDVIKKQKRYYGYFVLVTNTKMPVWDVLETYRSKDVVEKAFYNIKECLNMDRLLVSSEKSLEGKLFVCFIALIFLSYINKKMRKKKLYRDYTLYGLLDRLNLIECFEYEGKKIRYGEILEKQKQIYLALDVEPPKT